MQSSLPARADVSRSSFPPAFQEVPSDLAALRGQGSSVLVKNTQRGAEPVDRAPGELRASILAPVEAVHSFPKPANLLSLAPVGDIYLS